MNCSRDLIEAYLDGELSATEHAEVSRHLADCQACSGGLCGFAQSESRYQVGCSVLRCSARASTVDTRCPRTAGAGRGKQRIRELPWRSMAIAASLLLVTSLSWNLMYLRQRATQDDLAGSVVAGHIRSPLGAHLMDVASSDQHTVKPWFAGKLDFSPVVKDLEAQGFPLAGGRVDYLAGRRVAALIYHRRQHVINLFIWPSGSSDGKTNLSRDGYSVLHWSDGSMTYWAVSDASMVELENFHTLLTEAITPAPGR